LMPVRVKNSSARASAPCRSRSPPGYFFRAKVPAVLVTLKMRLLPPLRTSSMATTGAGASRAAARATGSGAFEDRVTNFGPVRRTLERSVPLRAEQNLSTRGRHAGVHQHLGQIVDENMAVEFADAADLLFARALEENLLRRQAEAAFVEEALLAHEAQ